MKIKEGLTNTGAVVGFINLGDVNDSLLQMESEDRWRAKIVMLPSMCWC